MYSYLHIYTLYMLQAGSFFCQVLFYFLIQETLDALFRSFLELFRIDFYTGYL